MGSICGFLGFSGGHGVISRFCLGNRALETVRRHTLRNRSLRPWLRSCEASASQLPWGTRPGPNSAASWDAFPAPALRLHFLGFGCVSGLPGRLPELKSPRCSAQSLQSKPNLIYRDFPVRFGFSPWLFRLFGGARGELTFAPRKSRSGDGLAPYSQESKLKA